MNNFIFGMLFTFILIPILNNFLAICEQLSRHICTWIAAKTCKYEKVINESVQQANTSTAIGFIAPAAEEDYDE